MATWYEELEYGIYNEILINRAEYYMLCKAGIQFIVK